eukprot:TRINITY_DN17018_c0_g1_i1.p1 TRINITY_DN17018_c0_g1~~TRINITY_DN17018_c0_g1_i1.p1  ORF type:complete len:917 (-),score=228.48 TRINITY_DN17018_c0_g1_i1:67-2817(-)
MRSVMSGRPCATCCARHSPSCHTYMSPLSSPSSSYTSRGMVRPWYYNLFPLHINLCISAMTHLSVPVRHSALDMIDLLVESYPLLLVPHGGALLPLYTDLLKSATNRTNVVAQATSASNVVGRTTNLQTRLAILRSLRGFLAAVLDHARRRSIPTPATTTTTTTEETAEARKAQAKYYLTDVEGTYYTKTDMSASVVEESMELPPPASEYREHMHHNLFDASVSSAPSSSSSSSSLSSSSSTTPAPASTIYRDFSSLSEHVHFFSVLFPYLVECWVEVAPANRGVTPPVASLEIMHLISDLIALLFYHMHRAAKIEDGINTGGWGGKDKTGRAKDVFTRKYLMDIGQHLLDVFPLAPSDPVLSGPQDPKEQMLCENINLCLAHIVTHFIGPYGTTIKPDPKPTTKSSKKVTSSASGANWIESVFSFVVESSESDGRMGAGQQARFIQILPVMRALLAWRDLPKDMGNALIDAFSRLNESCHPLSATKKACITFIATVILKGGSSSHGFVPPPSVAQQSLLALPKLLWNLGEGNPSTSSQILRVMSHFLRTSRPHPAVVEGIQTTLVPFFFTTLKPSPKRPEGAQIYGPFVKLAEAIQFQALDLIYYFNFISEPLEKALVACCMNVSVSARTVGRLLEVVAAHRRRHPHQFDLSRYLGFLLGVLVTSYSPQQGQAATPTGEPSGSSTKRKRGESDVEDKTTTSSSASSPIVIPSSPTPAPQGVSHDRANRVADHVSWRISQVRDAEVPSRTLLASLQGPLASVLEDASPALARGLVCMLAACLGPSPARELDEQLHARLATAIVALFLENVTPGSATVAHDISDALSVCTSLLINVNGLLVMVIQGLVPHGSPLPVVCDSLVCLLRDALLRRSLETPACKEAVQRVLATLLQKSNATQAAPGPSLATLVSEVGLFYS